MEDKIVQTTNGYKVSLRPFISYPKFIEIQKLITGKVVIDSKKIKAMKEGDESEDGSDISLTMENIYEQDEKMYRYLIKKIEDKNGQGINITEDYLPLPPKDCVEVIEEIKKISDEAAEAFSKKKETAL